MSARGIAQWMQRAAFLCGAMVAAGPAVAGGGDEQPSVGRLAEPRGIAVGGASNTLSADPEGGVDISPASAPRYAVSLGGGSRWMRGRALQWLGGEQQGALRARLERQLTEAPLGGLSAVLALSLSPAGDADVLNLGLTELVAGVSYAPSSLNLWGLVFPYASLELSAAWATVRSTSGLAGHRVLPGVGAIVGARGHLRHRARPRLSRLFFYAEGGYEGRLGRHFGLEPTDGDGADDADPMGSRPAIRVGSVNLSGWVFRCGAGLTL